MSSGTLYGTRSAGGLSLEKRIAIEAEPLGVQAHKTSRVTRAGEHREVAVLDGFEVRGTHGHLFGHLRERESRRFSGRAQDRIG
jgi:hypothetical protein